MPAQFKGFDSTCLYTNPDGVLTTLKGIQKRLKIFFEQSQIAYDPEAINVLVEDENEKEIVSGSYDDDFVQKESDGVFYIPSSGIVPVEYDLVAKAPKMYNIKWTWSDGEGSETLFALELLHVLSKITYDYFPRLRNQIDKAFKLTTCGRVGYTEANLYYYLQGGIDEINKFPPVTNFTLETFPKVYGQLLIDSATIVSLVSQSLFSVDTDSLAFSDQGFSFTTDHFSRLQSMLTMMITQVGNQLKMLKMEYSQIAGVVLQIVPNYPFATVLKTSPRGALFRNLFAT